MGDAPEFSLVLPCYNEAEIAEDSVRRVHAWMEASGWDYEVIWVDDGSTDDTPEILERAIRGKVRHRIVRYAPNRGKGSALKAGFAAARGHHLAFTDADLAFDLGQLAELRGLLRQGADAAIVCKRHARASIGYPLWRRAASGLYGAMARWATGLPYADMQSGMKTFRRDSTHSHLMAVRQDGWLWDTEALMRIHRSGGRIAEWPARMVAGPARPSRLRSFRAWLTILRDYRRLRRTLAP